MDLLLKRVCETKNVNIHLGKNYFVNIYMKMPTYYERFVQTAETIFDINGHAPKDVLPTIEEYFRINTSIN